MESEITKEYQPTEDEPYMSEKQLAYFKKILLDWRQELLEDSKKTLKRLQDNPLDIIEEVDRGAWESDLAFELRTRDRYRKLINKIDAALERIEDGSYGFCEETGEEIGIKRLMVRPIATLSVEAQMRHERRERQEERLKQW
jgi:DnaK suppressor protein